MASWSTNSMALTPDDLRRITTRTLAHYDRSAHEFWEGTRDHDVSQNIAAMLAHMKPGAWLLNFGRGALIVDADLIAATGSGHLAGAILDVFRTEPLPAAHAFWAASGIMVLPHIGGGHPDRDRTVAKLFVDNLTRFLDDKPLRELVDRAAGY